jgi:hypothetical protein
MADGGALLQSTKVLDDEPGFAPRENMTAADELVAPTHEDIAQLAYSYWEARGGTGGSPWEDWFRAEQELKSKAEL